jgi:hypothetical protein
MAFGRPPKKPDVAPAMTYDGDNGREIADWARDGDLSARFQAASGTTHDRVARILLPAEGAGQGFAWYPVPTGATIHRDPKDGELTMELPEDESAPPAQQTGFSA